MTQDFKKILKIVLISGFFITMVSYVFFQSYGLIFGVQIKNVSIVDGAKMDNNVVEISGVAKNAINLSLNGRLISIDQHGNFKETVALLPGYNVINLKTEDKFGNQDEKNYQLIY